EDDAGERDRSPGLDRLEGLEATTIAEGKLSRRGEGEQRLAIRTAVGDRAKLGDDLAAIGDIDRFPRLADVPQIVAEPVLQLTRADVHESNVALVATSSNPLDPVDVGCVPLGPATDTAAWAAISSAHASDVDACAPRCTAQPR